MDSFYDLLEDVQKRLGNADPDNSEWDTSVEFIEDLID